MYGSYKNELSSGPVLCHCKGQTFPLDLSLEVFNDSEARAENLLPVTAWLLGCRDVTGDRWKGREATAQPEEKGARAGHGGVPQSPVT